MSLTSDAASGLTSSHVPDIDAHQNDVTDVAPCRKGKYRRFSSQPHACTTGGHSFQVEGAHWRVKDLECSLVLLSIASWD